MSAISIMEGPFQERFALSALELKASIGTVVAQVVELLKYLSRKAISTRLSRSEHLFVDSIRKLSNRVSFTPSMQSLIMR